MRPNICDGCRCFLEDIPRSEDVKSRAWLNATVVSVIVSNVRCACQIVPICFVLALCFDMRVFTFCCVLGSRFIVQVLFESQVAGGCSLASER